jgi:uncharacterized protein YndB with AHSA1/START domain
LRLILQLDSEALRNQKSFNKNHTMNIKVQPNEIYIERIYDVSVAAVWDAWTDPLKVQQWWGPRGFTLTTHSKELKQGGHWNYTMHGPDGTDYPNSTVYHEVEECQKLVYDHGANDIQPPLFRVTALFSESGGKTKLQMTMGFATAEAAHAIRGFIKKAGGNATWDRLAEFLNETEHNQSSFVINRSFDRSVEQVYEAWANPGQLCAWLPPQGFKMELLHGDICSGGGFLCRMGNQEGVSFCVEFKYLKCFPTQIHFTQRFCDESGKSAPAPGLPVFPETRLNKVEFSPEENGMSRVTLTTTPTGTPSADEVKAFLDLRGSMTIGWSNSFDALESLLE